MKLKKVARNAATDINNTISSKLSKQEMDAVTGIIAEAMEQAVTKVTKRNIESCIGHLNPNTDIAHQIQQEIKRKQDTLIANLSSLR